MSGWPARRSALIVGDLAWTGAEDGSIGHGARGAMALVELTCPRRERSSTHDRATGAGGGDGARDSV